MNVTNKTQLPRMSLYILFTGIITALLVLGGIGITHASAATKNVHTCEDNSESFVTFTEWYESKDNNFWKQFTDDGVAPEIQSVYLAFNEYGSIDNDAEDAYLMSHYNNSLFLYVECLKTGDTNKGITFFGMATLPTDFIIDSLTAHYDYYEFMNNDGVHSFGGGIFYASSFAAPTVNSGNMGFSYVKYVPKLELPEEPTKEGHTFVGWYLDEALTQPYNGEPITEDMTFYAKFEINKYTVSFNAAGGNSVDSVTADWNTAVQCPTPTRLGYTFVGWFMADGTQYDGQPVTEDMTLTARWEIVVCTVTFKVNGEVYKTLQVEFGTTLVKAMDNDKMLKYMNLVNANGEKISKNTPVTEDSEVDVVEMTKEEKFGAFMARNSWLFWSVCALACAGILSTVLASVVAHKRG